MTESGINLEGSDFFHAEIREMAPRQGQELIDIITNEEKKHPSKFIYMANSLRGKS